MKVETKFNVGDKFYAIQNAKIQQWTVSEIDILIENNNTSIEYKDIEIIEPGSIKFLKGCFKEDKAFYSKEELVKNLLKD